MKISEFISLHVKCPICHGEIDSYISFTISEQDKPAATIGTICYRLEHEKDRHKDGAKVFTYKKYNYDFLQWGSGIVEAHYNTAPDTIKVFGLDNHISPESFSSFKLRNECRYDKDHFCVSSTSGNQYNTDVRVHLEHIKVDNITIINSHIVNQTIVQEGKVNLITELIPIHSWPTQSLNKMRARINYIKLLV